MDISYCVVFLKKHLLCLYGKLLVSSGAAVDTTDNEGSTALMKAAIKGHSQVAEVRNLMCICHDHNTVFFLHNDLSGTISTALYFQ